MDFEQFDNRPLREAKVGNLKPLIDRLREGKYLVSQEERDFLADYLEAKPKKRGPKVEISELDRNIFEAVAYLVEVQSVKRQAAEMQVADIVGKSDRAVRKIVKKCQDDHLFMFFRDEDALAKVFPYYAMLTRYASERQYPASNTMKTTVPELLRNEFLTK